MYANPQKTVDMLIRVPMLDPKKLIPALMRYDTQQFNKKDVMDDEPITSGLGMTFGDTKDNDDDQDDMKMGRNRADASAEHRNQAIRYLKYCIDSKNEKSKDPAIHNYLISLYCKQRTEAELLKFIEQQKAKPLFDVKYALRLCHQEHKTRSCVELYKIMKLYEEAIRLALTVPYNHYELAKRIAKRLGEKQSIHKNEQKRLWLIIARHVVDKLESDEIKEVLQIINESSVLSIEDILPHLKDFTEIGPFKKDIKASLEKYSQQIIKLQREMDDYTSNAEEIRKDTKQLLLRSSMITSNRKCDLSGKPILNTQFILFPCTHIFRFDELCKRIEEYRKQIGEYQPFQTRQEFMEYASRQCALCGDMMIDQVTRPFIDYDNEDDRKEAISWSVGDGIRDNLFSDNDFSIKHQQNKPKGKQITNLEDINIADLGFN